MTQSMKAGKSRWTPEDDADLVSMWMDGEAREEIAIKLGRTPVSITLRAYRVGLPRREKVGERVSLDVPAIRDEKEYEDEQGGAEDDDFRPAAAVAKMRGCLRCGKQFYSAHAGERICKQCKNEGDYQEAVASGKSESMAPQTMSGTGDFSAVIRSVG